MIKMKNLFFIAPAVSLMLASCGGPPSDTPEGLQGSYTLDEEDSPAVQNLAALLEMLKASDPDQAAMGDAALEVEINKRRLLQIDASGIFQYGNRVCKITDVNSIEGVKCGLSLADLTDEKLADPERSAWRDLTINSTSDGFRLTDGEGIWVYEKD